MVSTDTTISTLLVGVSPYYQSKFHDRLATKYMVLFLFILDTFHSVSVIYMVWNYIVTNNDNSAVLELVVWPYAFTPACTALSALIVQMFQGYRIWQISDKKFLYTGIIMLLAVPSFVLAIICSVETWLTVKAFSQQSRITSLVIAWLFMQVAVDAFITVTLIVIFSRSRTGFPRTDTVLNKLIRCTIQTGLFASIFCMAGAITFVVFPGTDSYGIFAIPAGRIYTNILLDSLLMRESLKEEMAAPLSIDHLPMASGFSTSQRASGMAEDDSVTQSPRSLRDSEV